MKYLFFPFVNLFDIVVVVGIYLAVGAIHLESFSFVPRLLLGVPIFAGTWWIGWKTPDLQKKYYYVFENEQDTEKL